VWVEKSPALEAPKLLYLETVINKRAGTSNQITLPSGHRDELDLYLKEPPQPNQGLMDY